MTTENTHNGWTNYATWRIALELFDGYEEKGATAESMEEFAEEMLFNDTPDGLVKDYARAFLHDVNWNEVAEQVGDVDNE